MSSAPTPEQIAQDATWLAQALDRQNGLARLVRMSQQDYRDASFLDDRMLQRPFQAHVVPWEGVRSAAALVGRSDARWIFHIGHVGSTLVSRLLGELDTVLSIREPRFFRDVAALGKAERGEYVPAAQKLFSRAFSERGLALVKTTSFVSEIADELVPQGERALFLFATPRNYIASILAGENSLKELSALAPIRARRLSVRAAVPEPRTAAEVAAIAWACEMTALESAAESMSDRKVAWADFDSMLGDMPNELLRLAQFFGFSAPADRIHAVSTGPLMGRYAKALEHAYSPSLRSELIGEAEAANRADIDSALAMLRRAAEKSPLLERSLARAEEN